MKSYPRDNEKCATCAHWGGERRVSGHSVEVDSIDEKGVCYAGTFSSSTSGFSSCREKCKNYEKWSALR